MMKPEHQCDQPSDPNGELARFIRVLNASASATLQLSRWRGSSIRADVIRRSERRAGGLEHRLLRLPAQAIVQHRHVRLYDEAGTILSDAESIVAIDRLPAVMRKDLRTTSIPLGSVIRPLNFQRIMLSQILRPSSQHILAVTAYLAVDQAPIACLHEYYRPTAIHPATRIRS